MAKPFWLAAVLNGESSYFLGAPRCVVVSDQLLLTKRQNNCQFFTYLDLFWKNLKIQR